MSHRFRTLALGGVLAVASVLFAAAPAQAATTDYVALGDSYSSGLGAGDYVDTHCHTSEHAYGYQVARHIDAKPSFQACAGAVTADVLDKQVEHLSKGTDLVTISIGGNDAGFADVIKQCNIPFTDCMDDIERAEKFITGELPGRLDKVYDAIADRAPNAHVIVVGYPRLFRGDNCSVINSIDSDERAALNKTSDLLAHTIKERVADHGFTFIDVRPAFKQHEICDSEPWVNGLTYPILDSYHPNRDGQDAYARLIEDELEPSAQV